MNVKVLIWADIDVPDATDTMTLKEIKKIIDVWDDSTILNAIFGFGEVIKIEDCD